MLENFQKLWNQLLDWLKGLGVEKISDADLSAILDKQAEGKNLRWRTSLVDFLKLIGADHDSESRAALGKEFGIEGVSGTAEYNEALRVALFNKIAENGGNIPAELRSID